MKDRGILHPRLAPVVTPMGHGEFRPYASVILYSGVDFTPE